MTNRNPDTNIAFGYISANALDPDIVNELQQNGEDPHYNDFVKEAQQEAANELTAKIVASGILDLNKPNSEISITDEDEVQEAAEQYVKDNWSGSDWEQRFNDAYQPDEPIHEGTKDGVKYRTSWLGGALNVWVFESPHVGRFQECSPCVPGAANLDYPEDRENACGVEGYDVPPEWRNSRG